MTTVYLGLGSNQGDRAALLAEAARIITETHLLTASRLSPLYETDAVTPDPQPAYLNAVLRGETALAPADLLDACLRTEARLGRVRPAGQCKAARTIDIDLLLYGAAVITTPKLTVPHPALLERPFVLIPLADVAAPGLVHPITGISLASARRSAAVRALVPPGRRR